MFLKREPRNQHHSAALVSQIEADLQNRLIKNKTVFQEQVINPLVSKVFEKYIGSEPYRVETNFNESRGQLEVTHLDHQQLNNNSERLIIVLLKGLDNSIKISRYKGKEYSMRKRLVLLESVYQTAVTEYPEVSDYIERILRPIHFPVEPWYQHKESLKSYIKRNETKLKETPVWLHH